MSSCRLAVLIAAPMGAGGFRRPSLLHGTPFSLVGEGFSAMKRFSGPGCTYICGPSESRFEGRSRRVSDGVGEIDGGLRRDEGGLRTAALGCVMTTCGIDVEAYGCDESCSRGELYGYVGDEGSMLNPEFNPDSASELILVQYPVVESKLEVLEGPREPGVFTPGKANIFGVTLRSPGQADGGD